VSDGEKNIPDKGDNMKLLTADLLGRLKPITDPGYDQNDPVVHAKFF